MRPHLPHLPMSLFHTFWRVSSTESQGAVEESHVTLWSRVIRDNDEAPMETLNNMWVRYKNYAFGGCVKWHLVTLHIRRRRIIKLLWLSAIVPPIAYFRHAFISTRTFTRRSQWHEISPSHAEKRTQSRKRRPIARTIRMDWLRRTKGSYVSSHRRCFV